MSMKINKLEIENVKRIKAVKVEPKANGLTVIGGNNNQGKTSVLDSIAWALGGERYKPSQATREGSVIQRLGSVEQKRFQQIPCRRMRAKMENLFRILISGDWWHNRSDGNRTWLGA